MKDSGERVMNQWSTGGSEKRVPFTFSTKFEGVEVVRILWENSREHAGPITYQLLIRNMRETTKN